LLRKLLPILDDLNRALAEMPPSVRELPWSAGLTLVKRKFDTFLQGEGVVVMETEGEMFDPTYHEALTYEDAEGYEEGQIIGEIQQGYMLGERVLRPALVRVAKAPIPEENNEDIEARADDTEDDKE
jgi:molecular chaperone GrpE